MACLPLPIFEGSIDIGILKIGVVAEDFLPALARSQHAEHVGNANPHPANTRAPAADLRIERNAVQVVGHQGRFRRLIKLPENKAARKRAYRALTPPAPSPAA